MLGKKCVSPCIKPDEKDSSMADLPTVPMPRFHYCHTKPWMMTFEKGENEIFPEDHYFSWDMCGYRFCGAENCSE